MLRSARSFKSVGVLLIVLCTFLFSLQCIATGSYIKDTNVRIGNTWISPGHFTAEKNAPITFKVKINVSVENDPEVHGIFLLIFDESGIMTNKTMFQGKIQFGEEKEVSTTHTITGEETQYKFGLDWTEQHTSSPKRNWDETYAYSITMASGEDLQDNVIPFPGIADVIIGFFVVSAIVRFKMCRTTR